MVSPNPVPVIAKPEASIAYDPSLAVLNFDDGLYDLDDEEILFNVEQTGIQDPAELKRHLMTIQAEIYPVSRPFCHSGAR